MSRMNMVVISILVLVLAGTVYADPPVHSSADRSAIADIKSAAGKKGVALYDLNNQYTGFKQASGKKARPVDFVQRSNLLPVKNGYVTIDAIAEPGKTQQLRTSLEQRGMQNVSVYKNVVSGRLPLDSLDSVDTAAGLHHARPAFAKTNVGSVDSQGDVSMQSKTARNQFGVTGAGQTVGVLSDSFNNAARLDADGNPCAFTLDPGVALTTAADDVASGDLPVVDVIDEIDDCGSNDEGRGMAQLIHDVAPGAAISFYSAFDGYADFADGIIALADNGANVIVDDIIYFAEPMFMDGLIAQATDIVNSRGIPYFSSAGNGAFESYESAFQSSGGPTSPLGQEQHDFDPDTGVDGFQSITFPPGQTVIAFQWDEPFFTDTGGLASSASDLDVFIYDETGYPCIVFPISFGGCALGNVIQVYGVDGNIGGDPVEIFAVINFTGEPVDLNLSLEIFDGPAPGYVKYVYFDPMTINEFDTMSGSSYGKAMANGAFGTGASAWFNTRPYNPSCKSCRPALINSFSSAGGTPIFFDPQGNRLATPEIRQKPNATGPDGGETTFFGFRLGFKTPRDIRQSPNFFGTSASAPHVAAVAALMLEANSWLDADDIFSILEATADDMDDARTPDPDIGFDFGTGWGFVNAEEALAGARGDICHNGTEITVKNSGSVSAHLDHGDTLGACE